MYTTRVLLLDSLLLKAFSPIFIVLFGSCTDKLKQLAKASFSILLRLFGKLIDSNFTQS